MPDGLIHCKRAGKIPRRAHTFRDCSCDPQRRHDGFARTGVDRSRTMLNVAVARTSTRLPADADGFVDRSPDQELAHPSVLRCSRRAERSTGKTGSPSGPTIAGAKGRAPFRQHARRERAAHLGGRRRPLTCITPRFVSRPRSTFANTTIRPPHSLDGTANASRRPGVGRLLGTSNPRGFA